MAKSRHELALKNILRGRMPYRQARHKIASVFLLADENLVESLNPFLLNELFKLRKNEWVALAFNSRDWRTLDRLRRQRSEIRDTEFLNLLKEYIVTNAPRVVALYNRDAAFFESAYDWDYGKWSEETGKNGERRPKFRPRPSPISIMDQKTHRAAREVVQSDFSKLPDFRRRVEQLSKGKLDSIALHLSPAGSGSAVVANEAIVSGIRGLNESIWAVDMECYGFYYAAKTTRVINPQFICIKSVSDFCNGEKGDDLHEVCSDISAAAVMEILTRHWEF